MSPRNPRTVGDRASTLRSTPAVKGAQPHYGLIVIVNGVVSTHTLPDDGEVSIGRARENDVQVIDASVSRVHAKIRLYGQRPTITDQGSANGTRVKGELIEEHVPVECPMGEPMDLGTAMLMLQHRPVATREWRIWAHGYFEGRLEEECARAARSSSTFGLVRIRTQEEGDQDVVQQVLASTLRADDVVGIYGPGEYEVLLVERSASEAKRIAEVLDASFTDVGMEVRMGTTAFPTDGRTADTLSSKAGAAARGEEEAPARGPMVLHSPAMKKLHDLLERVAPGDISLLILGETGVGKEVMAEEVHRLSPRNAKPFLRLNCAALSESLLESELFGHERGAFTGAHQVKAGLLETAQGGTVFLDEIGELPMSMQVKLLRVLEERQVWRVGGVKPRRIDVRFVAATNRDLEADVAKHVFRQDLFFRLNGVSLLIPPLRERCEEIPHLAQVFVVEVARQMSRTPPTLSAEVMDLMMGYTWPGNIRELRNAIERAVLLAGAGEILPEHFSVEKMRATISTPLSRPPAQPAPDTGVTATPVPDSANPGVYSETLVPPGEPGGEANVDLGERLRNHVNEVERQHIIDALTRCGGNQTRAAKELGISRRTLISRLERYKIPRPLKDRK